MRTEAGSPVTSLYGCQLSKYPELFCEKNGMPHKRTDKRGVREYVEKRYPQAISSIHNIHRSDLTIHDAMQYILTQPRTTDITWDDYFKLLWESKISPYFKISNAVALIFDSQTTTNSVKTLLQENRDNNSEYFRDVDISGDLQIPKDYKKWSELLANHNVYLWLYCIIKVSK